MSDPVLVIARVQIRPDSRERFLAAAQDFIAATRCENGCLACDIHENVAQPGCFVVLQSWEQREQIDLHMRQQHVRDFLLVAGACAESPPVVEVIQPRSIDRL